VVGLTALTVRAALLPILPVPKPGVPDEFGFLLAGDTFAHARLTNPTHNMWIHFETSSIIQKPTYQTFAPPGQGLMLAAGQLMTGNPFWGVWLSAGLMCAATCWMLQAWLPPFWAVLGGLLAAIRLATFSYWVNSYFGGCVAAIGGALVLGALPRIKRHQRLADVLLMGLGFIILANSRPYEGLFFCLPVAVALLIWMFSQNAPAWKLKFRRVAIPLCLMLFITAASVGYYFWRVTGSPLRNPYTVSLEQYFVTPYFPWQPLRPMPPYHNEILRRSYTGWALDLYQANREHPVIASMIKADMLWFFYLGPLLTFPILMLGIVLPRNFGFKDIGRRTRFLLLVACFTVLGSLLPIFHSPHYVAPLVCVIYALFLTSLQRIRHWHLRDQPTGLAMVRAMPTVGLALLVLCIGAPALHIPNSSAPWTWCSPWNQLVNRALIESHVEKLPGRHLLLVRYSPQHDPKEGWVFNHADIDNSKVVWANDMGPDQNQELIKYFKDRKVWLVEPDALPARISPYADVQSAPALTSNLTPQEHATHASH
jgi:hypothetical protein